MKLLERCDMGAVCHLRMSAPERLNVLSDELLADLRTQIDRLQQDKSVRVVVISGAGKAFCAGHDLRQMTEGRGADDGGRAYFTDLFARCAEVMTGLQRLPQPVIAQVHGVAAAAGCQLVAACDLAVAAEDSKFGVNGVNIGLFCSTPMVALTRAVARKHAFEMLVTGQFIDARRAQQIGLVNRVVPAETLTEATQELADLIASKLGAAVSIGKRTFYDQAEMGVEEAYHYAGGVMASNMLHRDTEDGISAFLEKRAPKWAQ